MIPWLAQRTRQERLALLSGGIAVTALLLYLLAWLPFSEYVAKQRQQVEAGQSTLSYVLRRGDEIKRLRSKSSAGVSAAKGPLLTLVDRTAKQSQLRDQIQRMKPDGADTVQIWIEGAEFNRLVNWLARMERDQGIAIESLNLDPHEDPGRVDARINLTRGGG